MLLIDLKRQKRQPAKIKGYNSRINEPKIWLAIFLLASPTPAVSAVPKQNNKSKENTGDINNIDESKNTYLPTDNSNFLTYPNFFNQTKNESFSNTEDYPSTNTENESKQKNIYMTINGTSNTTNIKDVYKLDNKDTDGVNNKETTVNTSHHNNIEIHDTPKVTSLDLIKEIFDKSDSYKARSLKRKIKVNNKLESVLNADIDLNQDDPSQENVKRKINTLRADKNTNKNLSKLKVEPRDITNAIDFGIKSLEELVKVTEPRLYRLGLFLKDDQPAARVANFGAPSSQRAILLSRIGYASLEASKKIAQSYPENVSRQSAGIPDELQSRIDLDACPLRGRPRCPPASRRFRTSDGTCNNLEHPWRGSAMLPMQRFLPPVYEDGIQSVRRSVFGQQLPSPRQISSIIHRDKNQEIRSVTLMFTQWGQFIDHDITSTVKSRSFNGSIPMCCDRGGRKMLPPDLLHPFCLPIEVPRTDPFLSRFGIGCMEFIRSAPSTRIDCELGWREQINQVTSYIDASTIYGSDVDTSDSIRTFRNGQIIYGRAHNQGPLNPPDPPGGEICTEGALSDECLQPGDGRLSENPGLVAIHTVFVRYHNRVAMVLSKINPHWSDERVFQETRRIVYSVIQHITYREYLPVVLGPEVMDLFELRVLKKGYYDKYEKRIIPTVANSFSTAAFRFGHSMVQNSFIRTDSHHIPLTNNVSLHEEFSNFENIWSFGSIDRILLGFSNQPSQKRDEFIADELTNHLFQFSDAVPFGMDLAAINIQRGRDHGIPPYTFWREPCGLSPIKEWKDLEKVMGINLVIRLKTLYRHVDDIDLFTGGLAEKSLRGGVVGPTFACIIAQQFSNLRKGDRFWYENEGFESSLSPAQLQQIRRVSLAQVICQTTDEIETIQPFVFLSADNLRNIRVSCDSPEIRNFDLGAWTEKSFEFNSISDNLDSFEQERSQKNDIDFFTRVRETGNTNITKLTHNKRRRKDSFDPLEPKKTKHSLDRHRREARSSKKNVKTTTTTTRPRRTTSKSKTKTVKKKSSKIEVTTDEPIDVTSITLPVEVKYGSFSNVPKKPNFSGYTTIKPTKNKPQYYQIQDHYHDDVTYLFGILPEHTSKAPIQTPLQVNINIHFSPQPTATTTPKKKKQPHVTTAANLLPNVYSTYKPISTGTHKPYGQNGVVLVTKRPVTSTKRPVTSSVSYPIFIYSSASDRPTYEAPSKKPSYFFNNYENMTPNKKRPNINGYNSPTDAFIKPSYTKPNTGYYDDNDNDRYSNPTYNKPTIIYQSDDDFHDTGYVQKPIQISTSDYTHSSNQPAFFEKKPFSSSNRPHYDTNKRPFSSYYFDNDDDTVVITDNRRPQTTAYNKDDNYSTDDILDEFFQQRDHLKNIDRHATDKTKLSEPLNINDRLDFKSRLLYKKTDKIDPDTDRFVKLSSVKTSEYFGREGEDIIDASGDEDKEKLRAKQKRSIKVIRVLTVDVVPSETRNQWKYYNATEEESMSYPEMPEPMVNMPCSYEVPKPMTEFLPSPESDNN